VDIAEERNTTGTLARKALLALPAPPISEPLVPVMFREGASRSWGTEVDRTKIGIRTVKSVVFAIKILNLGDTIRTVFDP